MGNTLDDIFNDDDFGLLNSKDKKSIVKTEEDRLVESFEEINLFFEKNDREPTDKGMSEVRLLMRLRGFRTDEKKIKILKPYDRFNLLGNVEETKLSLDEVFADDVLGLLKTDGDPSIFNFVHTPKPDKRAETDFVAQREAIPEEEFTMYEAMFQTVHKEIKSGKRKFHNFLNFDKNLQVGNFYLLDGLLLYLESADLTKEQKGLKSGDRLRVDGRTVTIFENGTKSNMLYRSLGKSIQKNGKLVTQPAFGHTEEVSSVKISNETDIESGWIYILRSKSVRSEIASIDNLFKVGFTLSDVHDRVKNAKREAAYLYDDVEIVASYKCYNLNSHKFESLIHRFLGNVCLDIDLYNKEGHRANPREWFVAPISVINKAIQLLVSGEIINYIYDSSIQRIVEK